MPRNRTGSGLPLELEEAGNKLLAYCDGTHELASLSKRYSGGPFPEKAKSLKRLLNARTDPPLRRAWQNLANSGVVDWWWWLDLLSDLPGLLNARVSDQRTELRNLADQIQKQAKELACLLRQATEAAESAGFLMNDDALNPLALMHFAQDMSKLKPAAAEANEHDSTSSARCDELSYSPGPAWIPTPAQATCLTYPYMDALLDTMVTVVMQDGIADFNPFDERTVAFGRQKPGKTAAVRLFDRIMSQEREKAVAAQAKGRGVSPGIPANTLDTPTTLALLSAALGLSVTSRDVQKARETQGNKTA